MSKEFAITCLNGNHTFVLHRTEQEAIDSFRSEPERYINTEMISDARGNNIHRGFQEGITSFLSAAIKMAEAQQSIGTYEI